MNDPFGDVHRPNASDWLDYEGELGFIIGRSAGMFLMKMLKIVSMVIQLLMTFQLEIGNSEDRLIL